MTNKVSSVINCLDLRLREVWWMSFTLIFREVFDIVSQNMLLFTLAGLGNQVDRTLCRCSASESLRVVKGPRFT